MASSRKTYKVQHVLMQGKGVKEWQQTVKAKFKKLGLNCPITIDGVYGLQTRTYTAELFKAMGYGRTTLFKKGLTPELRDKVGASKRNKTEEKNFHSKANKVYREKLKKAWAPVKVHRPVTKILADSWGYHPGVHDGLDVICPADAPIFAMVKCKVVDVRSSGWWGLGAPSNQALKAKGDGIIQVQVLENVGPFKKGMHIGYGHAEGARVKVGQVVNAGAHIGHAGLANAWHIHLMVNTGGTSKGIGNVDPRPLLNYAVKHG